MPVSELVWTRTLALPQRTEKRISGEWRRWANSSPTQGRWQIHELKSKQLIPNFLSVRDAVGPAPPFNEWTFYLIFFALGPTVLDKIRYLIYGKLHFGWFCYCSISWFWIRSGRALILFNQLIIKWHELRLQQLRTCKQLISYLPRVGANKRGGAAISWFFLFATCWRAAAL